MNTFPLNNQKTVSHLQSTVEDTINKKISQTSQDFEAVLLGQLLEYMMPKKSPSSLFGGGNAETTWQSFLTEEYAKELSQKNILGISDDLQRTILLLQAKLNS